MPPRPSVKSTGTHNNFAETKEMGNPSLVRSYLKLVIGLPAMTLLFWFIDDDGQIFLAYAIMAWIVIPTLAVTFLIALALARWAERHATKYDKQK